MTRPLMTKTEYQSIPIIANPAGFVNSRTHFFTHNPIKKIFSSFFKFFLTDFFTKKLFYGILYYTV